jgi:hypothetical protein
MPAKVSEKMRPTVTAGLANDVELVNQYAAPMYAPTAGAARTPRPVRASAKIRATRKVVATTLRQQVTTAGPVLGRDRRSHPEHQVRQNGTSHRPDHLRDRIRADLAQRDSVPGTTSQEPVGQRDDRVEVRPRHRTEQQDQHGQAKKRRGAVLQQLQTDIVR